MFQFEKDYICIAVNDTILKAVHLRGTAPALKLAGMMRQDVKDVALEEQVKLIRSGLSEANIKKASGICVIPAGVVTTKNIEIPSVDPQEIKAIIDLQAGRHTPFSREEIIIGYINIGVYQHNYTKVLLIIVNREVIKKQISLFDLLALRVEKVVFAPEAKALFYAKILNVKTGDGPIGIIDIGKRTTDFVIEQNATVIMCRSIPLGMENLLKEGPASRDKIVEELAKSLESYQSEDVSKLPETILFTTDDAKVKELQKILQERLKMNVKNVAQLDHIHGAQPVMLKMVSEFDDESFLDVLAAAIVQGEIRVDLMPEEVRVQQSIAEKGHQVVKAGSFALIILLLVCAIFLTKIYFRNEYRDKLVDSYEQKHQSVEELERISTNTRIVKDFLSKRMVSLEIVNELYNKIPNEIYLKTVNLDEEGAIRIQGVSDSPSIPYAFITVLEDSELFKSAKMISSNAQKERGKDVLAFEISFRLESAKDEEEVVMEAPSEAVAPPAAKEPAKK